MIWTKNNKEIIWFLTGCSANTDMIFVAAEWLLFAQRIILFLLTSQLTYKQCDHKSAQYTDKTRRLVVIHSKLGDWVNLITLILVIKWQIQPWSLSLYHCLLEGDSFNLAASGHTGQEIVSNILTMITGVSSSHQWQRFKQKLGATYELMKPICPQSVCCSTHNHWFHHQADCCSWAINMSLTGFNMASLQCTVFIFGLFQSRNILLIQNKDIFSQFFASDHPF